jgi:hypothetical protein
VGTDNDRDRPYVDTMSLTDVDTYVYETIATLEYTGLPAGRSEIAAAAELDDQTLDAALAKLVARGMLNRRDAGGQPAFEPADRGWSAAPQHTQGM